MNIVQEVLDAENALRTALSRYKATAKYAYLGEYRIARNLADIVQDEIQLDLTANKLKEEW